MFEEHEKNPIDENPLRKKTSLRTHLVNILKYVFSAALIYWMVSTDRLNLTSVKNVLTWDVVVVGFLLLTINISICSERWHALITTQGLQTSRFATLKLYFIGIFFNLVMPGGVGGDVIKGYYFVKKNPQARTSAMTTIFMDRLIGLYVMILMAAMAMTIHMKEVFEQDQLKNLYYFVIGLFTVSTTLGLLLLFSPVFLKLSANSMLNKIPLIHKMRKAFLVFKSYGSFPITIFYAAALSFVAQICSILFITYVGNKSGILDLPLEAYFFLAPLGFIATAIPIAPSGIGIGQAAFLFLFDAYAKVQTDLGSLVITVFQFMNFVVGLIGAFFYLTGRHQQQKVPRHQNQQAPQKSQQHPQ